MKLRNEISTYVNGHELVPG